MKKRLSSFLFLLNVLSLQACSTMYIHNGPVENDPALNYSEWHHDGILRLVEFSEPVLLSQKCEKNDWKTVKIEKTFIQGIASLFSYSIYDPWEVAFSCHE